MLSLFALGLILDSLMFVDLKRDNEKKHNTKGTENCRV